MSDENDGIGTISTTATNDQWRLMRSLEPPAAALAEQAQAVRVELEPVDEAVFFRIEDPTRTEGGLFVPQNAEERKRRIVVAVGPGRLLDDGTRFLPQAKPGDHVLLWPHVNAKGTEINGEVLYLCRASDIAAILRPAAS